MPDSDFTAESPRTPRSAEKSNHSAPPRRSRRLCGESHLSNTVFGPYLRVSSPDTEQFSFIGGRRTQALHDSRLVEHPPPYDLISALGRQITASSLMTVLLARLDVEGLAK